MTYEGIKTIKKQVQRWSFDCPICKSNSVANIDVEGADPNLNITCGNCMHENILNDWRLSLMHMYTVERTDIPTTVRLNWEKLKVAEKSKALKLKCTGCKNLDQTKFEVKLCKGSSHVKCRECDTIEPIYRMNRTTKDDRSKMSESNNKELMLKAKANKLKAKANKFKKIMRKIPK